MKHARVSPEIELLLTEVEKFRFRYRGHGASNDTAIDVVAHYVRRQLTDHGSFATDLILKRAWSVNDATNMLIAEHVSAEILSGQLHEGHGTLGDRGKSYLRLFKVCTERLINSGRMTEGEARDGSICLGRSCGISTAALSRQSWGL